MNKYLLAYGTNHMHQKDSVLNKCSIEEFEKINHTKLQRAFRQGQPLFEEGETPLGFFYISQGSVKIIKREPCGREQIIKIMEAGDAPGYQAILSNSAYSHSAIAINNVQASLILKHDYWEAINDNPLLENKLIQRMLLDYIEAEELIRVISSKSAKERLVLALLKQITYDDDGNEIVTISRSDLSNYTGIAKETTSRLLSELRKEGIITSKEKNIRILDSEKLRRTIAFYNSKAEIPV